MKNKRKTFILDTSVLLYDKNSIHSFKKRLAWHCHFIQKLYDQPDIESENLHPLYNGLRENSFNFDYYESWKNHFKHRNKSYKY